MRKLLLGLLLCSAGFGAFADWQYTEKVDEMREQLSTLQV